jgi:hypothetical protein
MSDIGFFAAFFLVILFLALTVGGEGQSGIFSQYAGTATSSRGESIPVVGNTPSEPTYTAPTPAPVNTAPPLTPAQVEEKVAAIYQKLDVLKKEIREATLREPRSPYSDRVSLSMGGVYDTDPDREYLLLRAEHTNTAGINISGWYLESYVTGEVAHIPDGDRLMERWRSPRETDIELLPGETAYLTTGDSPVVGSFRENICTGYLNDEATFYPSLTERCPYPKSELERFGKIELDNDRCYDLIERLSSCTIPDDAIAGRSKVGGACSTFIEDTFNHNDCVRLHRFDPYFGRDGYWRIYLDERKELWRAKREIIRLMDENDRVIDVLEY